MAKNSVAAELHVGVGQTYSKISDAIAASSAGDTITVHSGTYNEHELCPKSGIDDAHRTIVRGAPGEAMPIIDAQAAAGTNQAVLTIGGYACGAEIPRSSVTIDGLDLRNGGLITVMIAAEFGLTSNITIQNCKIAGTNTGGDLSSNNPSHIRISAGGTAKNILIKNNEIIGNYASGLKKYAANDSVPNVSTDLVIENNYIHDASLI